jgi:NAD(P)-dependent dehydrogenase (short-subunit alcohol dehydrogenase family)
MRLDGKVALISGAARGMGAAEARLFAREGARVVLCDVLEAEGQAVAAEVAAKGGHAAFTRLDVTREEDWAGAVALAESRFGGLHVLVNNAGIGAAGLVEDTTVEAWDRVMAINAKGVFLGTKAAIPALRRAGGGSIVLMSSIAGLRGAPGLAAYSATKGGVRLLAKSVALEHAADNIRCNSVHPGIIATPIWGKIPTGAEGNRRNAAIDPRERSAAVTPLVRVGEAQDIANGVLFLCTDAANYMTGQELVIDGGITAGGRPTRPQ